MHLGVVKLIVGIDINEMKKCKFVLYVEELYDSGIIYPCNTDKTSKYGKMEIKIWLKWEI